MKIAVLVPYFGGLDYEHLQCMLKLKALGTPDTLIVRELPNCPWIDMAQAFLADRALQDPDVDILFWIEHDMLFNPEDVFKLAQRCRDSEYDMLGAAYSQRRPGGLIVGGIVEDGPVEFFTDKLYPAEHCGLGFTATKRSLFERLRDVIRPTYCPAVDAEIHPYFAHIIADMYLGQDSSFCRRVMADGMKIGIDASIRVFHRGAYNYAIEDTAIMVPRYEKLTVNKPECTK